MFRIRALTWGAGALVLGWVVALAACDEGNAPGVGIGAQQELGPTESFAVRMVQEGRQIFRHDTFGSESFWGGTLRLHEAIAGQANGGVGDGLSPVAALSLGLKVDSEALPQELLDAIGNNQVDLEDPASTLALLQNNAVVGVAGFFDGDGQLNAVGITCALCHSTVDDSVAPGIGRRLGIRRHSPPRGLRTGRREPSHLHRLGKRHPLERPGVEPGDARAGDLL